MGALLGWAGMGKGEAVLRAAEPLPSGLAGRAAPPQPWKVLKKKTDFSSSFFFFFSEDKSPGSLITVNEL